MGRALLIAVLLCCTGGARADVFVVAPPYFEGTDGRTVSAEIARVIQEDLAKQHEVIGPGQVAAMVDKPYRVSCAEGDCAERYREAAGAVAAIVVRVGRAAAGPGPATSFQLGIQASPGVEYTQGALLSDGVLRELVVKALREALRDYRRGPGPWLEVLGAPERASVFVDDRSAGTLPWTDTLPLGTHRIRVEARGFEPMIRIVTLTSPTERKQLVFRLEPARAILAENDETERASNPADHEEKSKRGRRLMLAGTGFLVGGAGVALWPAVAHLRADCRDTEEGVCTKPEDVPLRYSASLAVTGSAIAATGIVLIGLGWRLGSSPRIESRVGVSARGIAVHGSF